MKKNLAKHWKMFRAMLAAKLRRRPAPKPSKQDRPMRPHELLGFDTADLDGQ